MLSKKWSESVRKAFLPDIAEYDRPDAVADPLTRSARDLSRFNVAPAVSPSGTQLVFISDRSMYNDIYLASALDGKVFKKLASGERTGTFETLRFFNTALAWSPVLVLWLGLSIPAFLADWFSEATVLIAGSAPQ